MKFYKHNGKELPRVTDITGQIDKSAALTYWAAGCTAEYILENLDIHEIYDKEYIDPDELFPIIESARKEFKNVSQKAMDIGSVVHQGIKHYFDTGKEPIDPIPEVKLAFDAFLEWKEKYQVEPIRTEQTVYADRYAGTLDLYCHMYIDGETKLYVVDFKASKGIYEEMRYQVAAYRNAMKLDKYAGELMGCGILRLDKVTGKPQWKDTSATYEQDLKAFNALLDLWYARHPKFKPYKEETNGNHS